MGPALVLLMTELRDPALLEPGFRGDVEALLDDLAGQGYEFRLTTTLRTVWQQARLWRQSRTRAEIQRRVIELHEAGAGYLADVIEGVGPQNGPQVTRAIPGLSWHQHGLAADAVLIVDGAAVWDAGHAGYRTYASTAARLGLTPGRGFGDAPHVQARRYEPTALPLAEVAAEMRERFGTSERDWLATNGRPSGAGEG